jgi:D-lactate dehydrogenase
MANDASHYLLTPEVIVRPEHASQIGELFRISREQSVGLTFRSGGTSLSGQGITSGLLVDVRRNFKEIDVLDNGLRIRIQPGATVKQANLALAKYGRKLGPDPASEVACTIGGVVANNSSGMACGTEFNTYATLDSLIFVLPSGTVVDTSKSDADEKLRKSEPALYEGLTQLRHRITSTHESVEKIRETYSIKNTMGYSLNSFLDYTKPVDILEHLIVGSEGTLAFIAEVVFNSVPLLPRQSTGLLIFPTLAAATDSLKSLKDTNATVIELLDSSSLLVAQREHMADSVLAGQVFIDHAAFLVEYEAATSDELDLVAENAQRMFAQLPSLPTTLSRDLKVRNELWKARKGLYAAVAGNRPVGTTALLEDIAVPVVALHETTRELSHLLNQHGYLDSVIFGHAKDGNLHFLLNEKFNEQEFVERYQRFTEDMVDLVLGHRGSLKAEHGTGRIMAPYVRRQFGDELYEVMVLIKALCDPHNILNPGVLINGDSKIYIQDLKTSPAVDKEVDRCVECGYCEPVCPSRELTLTPRQRIVIRRAVADAKAEGDHLLVKDLTKRYEYDGVQTCAVDGMCATACPLHIDTGELVRRLRAEKHGEVASVLGVISAGKWRAITSVLSAALRFAEKLPTNLVRGSNEIARKILSPEVIPLWNESLPSGGMKRQERSVSSPDVIFFPSCLNSLFASSEGRIGVQSAFLALCSRSNISVEVPAGIADLCCGTPWKSKGLTKGYEAMKRRTTEVLNKTVGRSSIPVVCDATSCTQGLEGAKSLDVLEYVAEVVLPKLAIKEKISSITLHPTCSGVQMELNDAMLVIARAVADEVVVPENWACCGFGGDRGMLHPELTNAATKFEAKEVKAHPTTRYASSNRPCEIGMSSATSQSYVHLIEILEEVSR